MLCVSAQISTHPFHTQQYDTVHHKLKQTAYKQVEDWLVALRDRPDEDVTNPRIGIRHSELRARCRYGKVMKQDLQHKQQVKDWLVVIPRRLDEDAIDPRTGVQYSQDRHYLFEDGKTRV